MTIKEALTKLKDAYPNRTPVGYWEVDDIIIINTKPFQGLAAPAQFAITSEGEVYGVTPTMYKLSIENMKKI